MRFLIGRMQSCTCLGLFVALLPTPSVASACEKLRPDWDGTQATLISEAITLFTSPGALFLLAATIVAVFFRHANGVLIATCLWAILTTVLTTTQSDFQALAMQEGCVASPALFIGAVAAICGASVLYTLRRNARL